MPRRIAAAVGTAAAVIYAALQQFFASSLFFILLGIGFLVAVFRLIDSTHPTLIFLLAILGVSIVLYGTGTQGVGTADIKRQANIRIAIAGGAGVLAGVFGFGVAWLGKDIQDVFKVPHQYARVVLTNNTKYEPDLRKLYITATSRDNRPLHLLAYEDRVEVLMPVTFFPEREAICVTLTLPPNKPVTGKPNCPPLVWTKNDGADSELITRVATGDLPLIEPKATKVDERNNPVAPPREEFEFR
jgi:hypothetical protein